MTLRHKSKDSNTLGSILAIVACLIMIGSWLLNINLVTLVFGVRHPAPPPEQVVVNHIKPAEVHVERTVLQATSDGYEHYTDKDGNEVVIVPARYEARTELASVQAAPVQKHSAVSPLAPQPVTQARNVSVQAAPPANLASIAMNAAAKAHTGMNVFESCRCNNGLATKGDSRQEVLEKCAQPDSRQFTTASDCREIWVYNFGPNEFMQGVCFDRNRVAKVLSLDHGY